MAPRSIYNVVTPAGMEREQPFPYREDKFLPAGHVFSTGAGGTAESQLDGSDSGIAAGAYGVIADHTNENPTTSTENSDAVARWLLGVAAGVASGQFHGGIRMNAHDSLALPVLIPPITGRDTDDFSIIGGSSTRDFFYLSGELNAPWLEICERLGLWTGDVMTHYIPAWDEANPTVERLPPYPPYNIRSEYYKGWGMFGRGLTSLGTPIIENGYNVSLQHGVAWSGRHDKMWFEDLQAYGLNGTAWWLAKSANQRLKFATTRAGALAGTANVNITSIGSGTITIVSSRETVTASSINTIADSITLTQATRIQPGDEVVVVSTGNRPGGIGSQIYYAIPKDTLVTTSGFEYANTASIRESNFNKLCAYNCGRRANSPGALYNPADPGAPAIIFSARGPTFGVNFLELDGLETSTWRGVGMLIEYEGVKVVGNRVSPGRNNTHIFNTRGLKCHGTGPVVDGTMPSNDAFYFYASEADFLTGSEGLRINLSDTGTGNHTVTRTSDGLSYVVSSRSVSVGHNLFWTPTWHNYRDGDIVRITSTTGVLPPELALDTDYWIETDPGVTQPFGMPTPSGQAVVVRGAVGFEMNHTEARITQAAWEHPEQFAWEFQGVDYTNLTNPPLAEIQYAENVSIHASITTCQNGFKVDGGGNHRIKITSHAGIRKKVDGAWYVGTMLDVGAAVTRPIFFECSREYEVLVKSAARASRLIHIKDSKLDPGVAWTTYRTLENREYSDKSNTAAVTNTGGINASIIEPGTYEFIFVLDFLTTVNAGFRFALIESGLTTTGSSRQLRTRKWAPGSTSYTEANTSGVPFPTNAAADTVTATANGYGRIELYGRLTVTAATNDGNEGLFIRWAQATAHADVTTSLSGAFSEIRKLA